MTAPFVYTEAEIAAVLRIVPEAVKAWLRRGELRPIALTSDGRPLFALRDVEAIGRRLASTENVRVLWPRQGASGVPGSSEVRRRPVQPPIP
jgi:hypothetical protein